MSSLFDNPATRPVPTPPDGAFRRCTACNGMGFHRIGEFAERTYPRCKPCGGIGQIYLNLPPPPPTEP